MYKVLNEYLSKISLQAGEEIRLFLCEQIKSISDVKTFSVTERAKQYIIDMKLISFSVDTAKNVFHELQEKLSYAYSSIYVRYNEGRCVRYRFLTCCEHKEGIYCDLIFS